MQQPTVTTEYTVDLSREEYVRSQELVAKRLGGMAAGTRWISLIMLVVCVVMGVMNVRYAGTIDWSLISLLVLLVVSEVWMMVSIPAQMRRRSEDAYDATVYSGYVFAGTITLEPDAIRKRTESATTVIPYEQCRVYIETADMMIFCGMAGKSIVISARFLTEETAEATRQAALSHIPTPRQALFEKLIPAKQPVEEIRDETETDETLLTLDVEYTDSEIVSLVTDTVLERFVTTLPGKCLFATMIASVAYFSLLIKPLPVFLISMLVFLVGSIVKARVKMRRSITHSERDVCRLRVEFTGRVVRLIGKADGIRPMTLPWRYITRAVECRDTVDLYTGKTRQLSIPKRCISDFEELREIVDRYVK